ncbi:MAG: hypothetical protein KF865_01900 [Bdellovibrionaceae bacterium]|nr:hypothetical protein [Pseudobdellovibrionaceae bacterium]
MKTSLILDDAVFEDAKKESLKSGRTLSEVISEWARMGRDQWRRRRQGPKTEFKAVNLGAPLMDLRSRKKWMEDLDDDRS